MTIVHNMLSAIVKDIIGGDSNGILVITMHGNRSNDGNPHITHVVA